MLAVAFCVVTFAAITPAIIETFAYFDFCVVVSQNLDSPTVMIALYRLAILKLQLDSTFFILVCLCMSQIYNK